MTWFIFLLIGFGVGYVIGLRRGRGGGQDAAHKAVAERKEAAKGRVMGLFGGKQEIANDDVEALLGVSDATATNYLSELEAEGKISQIGNEGRGVTYRKNV